MHYLLQSGQSLHRKLQSIDPAAAEKIHPSNIRRLVRALEIYYATGGVPSRLQRKEEPGFSVLIIGLTQARSELYTRIDERVDKMIQKGVVEEMEQLVNKGYDTSVPSMSGIGYRQIGQFLRREMTLPEAIDKMKHATHRLARHQYAWFRLTDSRIRWFDVGRAEGRASTTPLNKVKTLVGGFMS